MYKYGRSGANSMYFGGLAGILSCGYSETIIFPSYVTELAIIAQELISEVFIILSISPVFKAL